METLKLVIAPKGDGWIVEENGSPGDTPYVTREAASRQLSVRHLMPLKRVWRFQFL